MANNYKTEHNTWKAVCILQSNIRTYKFTVIFFFFEIKFTVILENHVLQEKKLHSELSPSKKTKMNNGPFIANWDVILPSSQKWTH
jgi:hypothetical protein